MKRIKDIIIWTLVLAYLVIAISFMVEKRDALVCSKVEVRVKDSLKNEFVEEKYILNYLERKGIKLIGKNFKDINLESIESIINEYPPVGTSEVYKTVDGTLMIDIKQRNPIIRIIDKNYLSYYIDENGFVMRTNGNYTSHVIIANGNIHTDFPVDNKINVVNLEEKTPAAYKTIANLYRLGKYITENKLWNAQIQQIYVNASGDFELIPRVGSHIIIFGDYSDCETKFANLMSLYKNGLPAKGWNTYETINLKYKGQVICTKRE
jgi:cell division protein FtsQ